MPCCCSPSCLGLQGGEIVTPLSILIAVLALVALGILFKITPKAAVVHHTVDGVKTPIPKAAWILGVMALAFGLSEGTATDWSSLHVTDVAGVDPTTGALGLVTVSAFMVVIRLLGDRLVTRFGRRTVVRFGALFAAIGYLTVTLVSSLPMLVVGWALVGFGVGMIAPQVYAVAGHIGGGRVLAVVVTFGYAAFLIGPAFMGFLVNQRRDPSRHGRTGVAVCRHYRPGVDHAAQRRRARASASERRRRNLCANSLGWENIGHRPVHPTSSAPSPVERLEFR